MDEVTTPPTRHVVVMGVSGCGKSTVAEGIGGAMGLPFAEADGFHSEANIAKMHVGTPLTDEDRWPWLEAMATWMADQSARGRSSVMACSALRRAYRDVLRDGPPGLQFVHLDGPIEVVRSRMEARQDHFMPASLLDSQYATLEPLEADEDAVAIDLRATPPELVTAAVQWLRENPPRVG